MKNYYISFIFILLSIMSLRAQIGINTNAPQAALDILSSTAISTGKALRAANSDNFETLQIRNDGYIGIGATNPLVKLDLRADNLSKENAIGIGYTGLSAAAAGAGAIRYEPTSKVLQYSDGVTWFTLQTNPAKAMLIAQNSSGYVVPHESPIVVSGVLGGWTTMYDQTGNFNPSTGYFTASRTGIYSVSATAVFQNGTMQAGGQCELNIGITNSSQVVVAFLKSVVPYLSAVASTDLTNISKGLFYVQAGQKIRISAYMYGITSAATLSTDPAMNVLTIAEM